MSSVITRAEARRRMAAQQGPNPGQGWSAARPTRTPWRSLKRARAVESSPEPIMSSDSDVEMVDDPITEQREWRLRKATRDGRIPPGTSAVGGQTPEIRDEEATPSSGHIEAVSRAMAQKQAGPEVRDPAEQEREQEPERKAKLHRHHVEAAIRWHAKLKEAEEEERRMWEVPPTPRYLAEEPAAEGKDEEEEWTPSPPRWLPEVPPTLRYEPKWHFGEEPVSEEEAPMATPPWRPEVPLTPRGDPEGHRDEDPGNGGEVPRATPPWRPARPPTPRYPQPEPSTPETPFPTTEGSTTVRTDVPAAHVSHSTRAFIAEGVRWRQQSVVSTWPEGPVTEADGDKPRIWEEEAPHMNPRDPRKRGRPDAWAPPTPSTGPCDMKEATHSEEPLEKGPWVWPVDQSIIRSQSSSRSVDKQ
ncbi:proteoglycan 4-like [Drosophila rhopaloa]|uniref:Uncharacterized protein n=1 Tax=Drosophila rhopaloa TaxID=1041015 RepID=A0ABM5J0Z3_DRORH|nr:proteoglycan 4-like [Drosophila rhopaloa]